MSLFEINETAVYLKWENFNLTYVWSQLYAKAQTNCKHLRNYTILSFYLLSLGNFSFQCITTLLCSHRWEQVDPVMLT